VAYKENIEYCEKCGAILEMTNICQVCEEPTPTDEYNQENDYVEEENDYLEEENDSNVIGNKLS